MTLHLAVAVRQVNWRSAFSVHNVWLSSQPQQHLDGLEMPVPGSVMQHRVPLVVLLVDSPWLLLENLPQTRHVTSRRSFVQGPWCWHTFATLTATQICSHSAARDVSNDEEQLQAKQRRKPSSTTNNACILLMRNAEQNGCRKNSIGPRQKSFPSLQLISSRMAIFSVASQTTCDLL